MSLEKAIKSGKEHRKPYRLNKAVDPMCRNHKGCSWCEGGRQYQKNKEIEKAKDKIKENNLNEI